jgi:hypothetical protein
MPLRGRRIPSSVTTEEPGNTAAINISKRGLIASASATGKLANESPHNFGRQPHPKTQTTCRFSPTKLSKNETNASAHAFGWTTRPLAEGHVSIGDQPVNSRTQKNLNSQNRVVI